MKTFRVMTVVALGLAGAAWAYGSGPDASAALAGAAWAHGSGSDASAAATATGSARISAAGAMATGTAATWQMAPDTTGAALWSYLQQQDYQENWALYPGTTELYEGTEPHGMLLTTYVNDAARRALRNDADRMPDGAIIVKENYTPNADLAAITVMYKRDGYNAEHHDWFFAKYLPDGSLDQAPNGMALQGRVPGCQACHSAQREHDYLFMGNM